MSEDDSFMQIVREKLYDFEFLESSNSPGLFFNSSIEADRIFYVDMRMTPRRIYGYVKREGRKDIPINDAEVREKLKDIIKMLSTIGCPSLDKFEEPRIIKSCPHCGGNL